MWSSACEQLAVYPHKCNPKPTNIGFNKMAFSMSPIETRGADTEGSRVHSIKRLTNFLHKTDSTARTSEVSRGTFSESVTGYGSNRWLFDFPTSPGRMGSGVRKHVFCLTLKWNMECAHLAFRDVFGARFGPARPGLALTIIYFSLLHFLLFCFFSLVFFVFFEEKTSFFEPVCSSRPGSGLPFFNFPMFLLLLFFCFSFSLCSIHACYFMISTSLFFQFLLSQKKACSLFSFMFVISRRGSTCVVSLQETDQVLGNIGSVLSSGLPR